MEKIKPAVTERSDLGDLDEPNLLTLFAFLDFQNSDAWNKIDIASIERFLTNFKLSIQDVKEQLTPAVTEKYEF